MKKYSIVTIALLFTTFGFATNVDSLNLKSMYEGAKEMDMLNKSMEAGMKEHNQKVQPLLLETTTHSIDKSPIEDFKDLGDKFYLEKPIEDSKNTKVKVTIHGEMIKISTETTKKEQISTVHGTTESSYSSNSVEELPIPFEADITKMKKEYKNGILKITILKKRKR